MKHEKIFQKLKDDGTNKTIVALVGNPNTGKTTVFNSLTGLRQHTGNWPGKTVTNTVGTFVYNGKAFTLVDLPGTYSLLAKSAEEEVTRDYILFGKPQATIIVTDATCLERNLNLTLQILEITNKVVVCVNLMDEAERKKIYINLKLLSQLLGVPVIGTNARDGVGLEELKNTVWEVVNGNITPQPVNINYSKSILENPLDILEPLVQEIVKDNINHNWLSLRLLEGDRTAWDILNKYMNGNVQKQNLLDNTLGQILKTLATEGITQNDILDAIVCAIMKTAEEIGNKVVFFENQEHTDLNRTIDKILTSRQFGIPIILLLLGIVFWITIKGANYPSALLAQAFAWGEIRLANLFTSLKFPNWIHGLLIYGAYRTLSWVISVMLPPMAIFFPLFTLLEDLGYLPRVAFNLDNFFKKVCSHGKQSLTMCMGFGCNAVGVIACRIIDSPRERLIAIITNNFVPCNGRFPTLIALSAIFIGNVGGTYHSFVAALTVLAAVIAGILTTLAVSWILSVTILKGLPSSFTLELPPYRKPQIGRILVRSLLDRTLFVLTRAIIVAAPAGLLIWLMANVHIGDTSILDHTAKFLHPVAYIMGLDGYVLMAFILGFPANEIVMPIIIMSYMSAGAIMELNSLHALGKLLTANNWTFLTAICTMLFSLNHFPCGTTLLTIKKETQSLKWTFLSFLLPTLIGFLLCTIVTGLARLLGFA
jgi:ferrous iron transport protein B